jgi:Fur family ferric uptake transcriptional regulator
MKRNTAQRGAIEQVFNRHKRPLGVDEVLAYGRELVASLNQATVYRNLKNLVDGGWLVRISHPSLGTLYERSGKEHHHYFHCRACNRAYELPGCALRQEGAAPDGFVVEDHEVFLSGVCAACDGRGT